MGKLVLEEHGAIQEAFSTVGTNIGLGGKQAQPLAEALLPLRHFKGLSWGFSSALRSTWIGIPSKREPGGSKLRWLGSLVCDEAI